LIESPKLTQPIITQVKLVVPANLEDKWDDGLNILREILKLRKIPFPKYKF